MNTLLEIEEAIDRLPREQVMELVDRLEKRVSDDWDRKFESDVKAGKLDSLAQRALAEHRAGQSTPFPKHEE
jgi:hypothetical protein